jgi:chemotaxis protein methyltransferase CheR
MPHADDPTEMLAELGARVTAFAGLRPPPWVLRSRVHERVAALGLPTLAAYLGLLASSDGPRELQALLEVLRVGETRFFRHASHMRALRDVVVPALRPRAALRGRVRAWSAGCATGEEAYSLAILLRQGLPSGVAVEVLATDLSAEALAVARAGVYPEDTLGQVPAELRWAFSWTDGGWQVAPELLALVRFEKRNLTSDWLPREAFDVLLCRNVLIYFDETMRARTVARLVDSLAPGGFLFVGYAETLRHCDGLEAMRGADTIVYRKRVGPQATGRDSAAAPASGTAGADEGTGAVPDEAADAGPAPGAAAAAGAVQTTAGGPRVIVLAGRYDDGERLTGELFAALAESNRHVIVDADQVEYLGEGAAAVLRRARAAARAAGVTWTVRATRPGLVRWLSRAGLFCATDEGSA